MDGTYRAGPENLEEILCGQLRGYIPDGGIHTSNVHPREIFRKWHVRRTTDAKLVNKVVNHPGVKGNIAPNVQQKLDLENFVRDDRNYALWTDGGGFLFHCHEPGVYEVHTQFVPHARGQNVVRAMRDAVSYMFLCTTAMQLLTKCHDGNPAAKRLSLLSGGKEIFRRAHGWHDGTAMVYYRLDYEDWKQQADWLDEMGHWFHQKCENADIRHSEDDPCHIRAAGAAVGMIMSGQVGKGIILYNRWAKFAGYGTVSMRSTEPLVLTMDGYDLHISGDDFEVVKCQ